jgi:hypothetical protein
MKVPDDFCVDAIRTDSGCPTHAPSTADVIKALEYIGAELATKCFSNSALLKSVVITLSNKGTRKASGWFSCDKIWGEKKERSDMYHEINICPEELIEPPEHAIGILLHELVHLWCSDNGIQDSSSKSQYHNRKFRDAAEQHGLKAEIRKPYGYVNTSLKPETLDFIRTLDLTAFDLYRRDKRASNSEVEGDEAGGGADPKTSSTINYHCPLCDTNIRATKEVIVRCDGCEVLFEKGAAPKRVSKDGACNQGNND